MEMHQVRYFLAVAEALNFTRAAEACNVTQPTMTRAIKLLEQEFGGALFHRDRSQTELTELGRMMLPHMQQIWQKTADAKRVAASYGKAERTVLRLGMMCTIAPSALLMLMRAMRQKHPAIELIVTDAAGALLEEQLLAGEIDVAIYAKSDTFGDRLYHVALYREPFVIAVAPDSTLADAATIRVADLDGLDYIDRINCEFGEYALRIFEQQRIKDRTVYRSDRDDWVLAMVAAGFGYAFIPEQCASHPGVVARRLIEPEIWREVCLITVRGRPHAPPVGALVREAARLFRQQPMPDETVELGVPIEPEPRAG
jgi:DNA-binding transcriptional LysR family regulator